ncbi:hypothetical protein LTR28_001738, partial [Elasticomyces elasticus]
GAGVGAVKEKTEQYKAEQRRAAEARGEQYEESSEEERKARRRRSQKAGTKGGMGMGSGTSTPGGGRKHKIKYRTVADVEAAAPGLEVPVKMLSSIIDATGTEHKLLTSTAGLMTPTGFSSDTEGEKVAKRERLELEAFIEAWHGLQERKLHVEAHEGHLQLELDQEQEEIVKLKAISEAVEALSVAHSTRDGERGLLSTRWDQLVGQLETLQNEHKHDIESYNLTEAAIAAIHPLFKESLDDWEPLEDPARLVDYLTRLKPILGIRDSNEVATFNDLDESITHHRSRRQKATTPYETLMYTLWLPKLRPTVTRWDVHDPAPMISLVQAWQPLLPPFVYSNLLDQLIIQKLSSALQSWNPRIASKMNHKHHHRKPKESTASLPH